MNKTQEIIDALPPTETIPRNLVLKAIDVAYGVGRGDGMEYAKDVLLN